ITGDRDRDLIGNKNGIQIIVQAKSSETGRYPKLEKEYKNLYGIWKIEDLLKK
ncbi:12765_t:CDS:1, partial [Dentiscutata erythropus]